jgi:chemotaxis protein CheD
MQALLQAAPRGYFDQRFNARIVNVPPGGHDISDVADEVLSTVLGSCVAACLRDPMAGIGGMNHFLLPGEDGLAEGQSLDDLRFGTAAMEVLVNALLKRGALRSRLEAKVFGGAAMMATAGEAVGTKNAAFIVAFLAREGIPVKSQDLGGAHPRRVNYAPVSGRAWINSLDLHRAAGIRVSEQTYRSSLARREDVADVEVF